VLALAALVCASSSRAAPRAACPRAAELGTASFVRAARTHTVSLATCVDRVAGRAARPQTARPQLRSPDGQLIATIRSTGSGRSAKQTIWVTDRRTGRSRAVASETQYYTHIGPGDTPGPVVLLRISDDDRWVFFTVDPGGSGSIAADGLMLRTVSTTGGAVHKLGVALAYPDYLAWCRGRLVLVAGGDRVAAHAKRLLAAAPPDWGLRPVWNDRARSFGSVSCHDGRLAVLSQRSSNDPSFFSTRWQLWQIGPGGGRQELDAPPWGWADESPQWSRDGRSLLFVRERNGNGRLMVWRSGRVFGPIASLGFSPGFYGHHDWAVRWSAA
jgi:dipeptidyl aminopeptidase/acylaminoacyl peptidase